MSKVATVCCDTLADYLNWSCDQHDDPWDCADCILIEGDFGVAIPIHDGGSSHILIRYCP